MKKKRDRRNEAEAFTFINSTVSTTSKADLHSPSDSLPQTTTNTTQGTLPHATTYSKVVNVVHREINGDRVATFNTLKNSVSHLPPIMSTSTSQVMDNSVDDEVSYHPMFIDEPDLDTAVPELEDVINEDSRKQVRSLQVRVIGCASVLKMISCVLRMHRY